MAWLDLGSLIALSVEWAKAMLVTDQQADGKHQQQQLPWLIGVYLGAQLLTWLGPPLLFMLWSPLLVILWWAINLYFLRDQSQRLFATTLVPWLKPRLAALLRACIRLINAANTETIGAVPSSSPGTAATSATQTSLPPSTGLAGSTDPRPALFDYLWDSVSTMYQRRRGVGNNNRS